MTNKKHTTIADFEGEWRDQNWESGLIARCKRGWNTPVTELSNASIAMYLRQKVALPLIIPETRKRIAERFSDDSELYDGEMEQALRDATGEA